MLASVLVCYVQEHLTTNYSNPTVLYYFFCENYHAFYEISSVFDFDGLVLTIVHNSTEGLDTGAGVEELNIEAELEEEVYLSLVIRNRLLKDFSLNPCFN